MLLGYYLLIPLGDLPFPLSMDCSISAIVSFRGMVFSPFLETETAANAGPRCCHCKEKREAAKLRSLDSFRWVDCSVVPFTKPGKRKWKVSVTAAFHCLSAFPDTWFVFSRCEKVFQEKHDPRVPESRGSHFYVYSISWGNTDMQLTSY